MSKELASAPKAYPITPMISSIDEMTAHQRSSVSLPPLRPKLSSPPYISTSALPLGNRAFTSIDNLFQEDQLKGQSVDDKLPNSLSVTQGFSFPTGESTAPSVTPGIWWTSTPLDTTDDFHKNTTGYFDSTFNQTLKASEEKIIDESIQPNPEDLSIVESMPLTKTTLPLTKSSDQSPSLHSPASSLTGRPFRKMVTVLVADDNSISRNIMVKFLDLKKIKHFEAEDGVQAVEVYKQHRPSVCLMDIQMPRKDGLDAVKDIRSYEDQMALERATIVSRYSISKSYP
jgi:hypothetical protein